MFVQIVQKSKNDPISVMRIRLKPKTVQKSCHTLVTNIP